jgi:hypothetical protein
MHRRPLGRGRTLAVVSALVTLVGCLLPWFAIGGGADLPLRQLGAFSGSGVLAFIAALATLAVVVLPYAAGDRPVGLDRWPVYAILAAIAVIGVVYWIVTLLGDTAPGLLPDRAPGLWVAAAGGIGLSRAAYDIAHEPPIP